MASLASHPSDWVSYTDVDVIVREDLVKFQVVSLQHGSCRLCRRHLRARRALQLQTLKYVTTVLSRYATERFETSRPMGGRFAESSTISLTWTDHSLFLLHLQPCLSHPRIHQIMLSAAEWASLQ